MLFSAISVGLVLGLLYRKSYSRFKAANAVEGKAPSPPAAKAYGTWLRGRVKSLFSGATFDKAWNILKDWTAANYPGRTKWIFIGLGASWLYQAASGFFFALFIPRGLFGAPLLGHVALGGLFAVSLAAALVWRGRSYRLDNEETAVFEGFARPLFKNPSGALARKILFWAVALFGFIQVTTAFGSMLPFFDSATQEAFITIHRYSALAVLLTAIVFIDMTFIPQYKGGESS